MRTIAVTVGSVMLVAAGAVLAQAGDYPRNQYNEEPRYAAVERECWNSNAGRFELVRPGVRQDDLDFSRCRRR